MIQILLLVVGVVCIAMAIGAMIKGEVRLNQNTAIRGSVAILIAVVLLLFGFFVIGFALIGLPLLFAV